MLCLKEEESGSDEGSPPSMSKHQLSQTEGNRGKGRGRGRKLAGEVSQRRQAGDPGMKDPYLQKTLGLCSASLAKGAELPHPRT